MKTRVLKASGAGRRRNIMAAARLIRKGEIVAFPTETVYGLGANIFDPKAVRKIFRVKGRPSDNPLIIHVWSLDQVHFLARSLPVMFWVLADRFMPGPLTVVLKRSDAVSREVSSGLSTIAVRLPDHPVARALLKEAGVPLAAPSANLSGRPSPTKAEHVLEDLNGKIAAILDGGRSRIGLESTVLDLTRGIPTILRPGGVTREAIEDAIGLHVRVARPFLRRPASPGMKYRHYAPRAELILFEGRDKDVIRAMRTSFRVMSRTRKVGIMAQQRAAGLFPRVTFYSLGQSGREAARRLFNGFRRMEKLHATAVLCQGFEEKEIGSALMNRLRKAATRRIRV
jgi:L-threonylcarbamoyladenylate synthase